MNAGGQESKAPVTKAMYLQILKEPRGLIRVLQWVFSIFAFSTTAGFWTSVTFKINGICDTPSTIEYQYPFKIEDAVSSTCQQVRIVGDMSTQAEYFVTVGVLTFLYCIGILLVYFFFEPLYQTNALLPMIDFGVTGVFAIFWLTSSSAWAQGVSDVKCYANPCSTCSGSSYGNTCVVLSDGSYATLNVSLIFGFANFALWVASLWFIYKETEWFKRRNEAVGNNPT